MVNFRGAAEKYRSESTWQRKMEIPNMVWFTRQSFEQSGFGSEVLCGSNRSIVKRGVVPFVVSLLLTSCSPTAGPDKTLAGGVLGAAWGAGAGAVVGNQTGMSGGAPGVGAGLGAAGGMLTGAGLDIAEGGELEQRRQIDALKVRVGANERNLRLLQTELDNRERQLRSMSGGEAIVFNRGRAALHSGSVERLERIANAIKNDPHVRRVEVHGHSHDGGSEERNQQLSAARAETVANFLSQNGVPAELIKTVPRGSSQPLLSEASGDGSQLNQRAEVVVIR